jgi:hypothetical protein
MHNPNKICNICGKPYEYALRIGYNDKTGEQWCIHDTPSAKDKREIMRRSNREQTIEAQRMAAQAMAAEQAVNPDVILSPVDSPDNRSVYAREPIKIKKSLLEAIESKSPY